MAVFRISFFLTEYLENKVNSLRVFMKFLNSGTFVLYDIITDLNSDSSSGEVSSMGINFCNSSLDA